MASRAFLLVLTILFPTVAFSKDFIVGDYNGWTQNFDYQAWANGKEFVVGDRLIFKYPVGAHNVFKVNVTGFQYCIKPPLSEALTTGYDIIMLATPGRKWYICGVAQHCAIGRQKLAISVNPVSMPPTMPPSYSPSPRVPKDFIVGDDKGWTPYFNYQAWAQGKDFRVGDRLIFRYASGAHNVFKVDGPSFQSCIMPPVNQALTSGNDIIVLATPGRKWYICGVAQHCAVGGQKLVITVNPVSMPPSAAPSST